MRLPFVLARRFVAGETFQDALPVVHELRSRGMSAALDLLGESVRDRSVAEAGRDAYVELVGEVARERRLRSLDANVSIKLSMMGQAIDEDFCLENLRVLLDAALEKDVFVRLDMEGSETTASTLTLFEKVYPDYPDHVGIVLQAYLKRTDRDVERMCALDARVRICKGAYNEPTDVAYQDMRVIRERFMVYADRLIEGSRFPGIATHDDRLISATKAFAEARDIGRDRFEFQMLYGIRPDAQQSLVQEGYNMRVYLPYGTEWMPYFGRRLRERRENVWFVLRHLLRR